MNRLIPILLATLVSGLAAASPVQADSIDGKRVVGKAIEAGFSELERQVIEHYYRGRKYDDDRRGEHKDRKGKKKGLPPGLAKKESLPPGLQKQLERNGTLPPGLAKRDLPDDLHGKLPPVQGGFERVIVDSSVLLVEKASGVIRDIIRDVVH